MLLSKIDKNKRQNYILIFSSIVILIILFFFFAKISQKFAPGPVRKAIRPVSIRIDFNLLESPLLLKYFRLYNLIALPTANNSGTASTTLKVGRPNPFLPY